MILRGYRDKRKVVCIIYPEFLSRKVMSKVNDTVETFNNKSTILLPHHTIYSRIKELCFYAALTGKARHWQ